MEGPLRVGRSGGRLGFVKNVVCSSVGTVAASVRLSTCMPVITALIVYVPLQVKKLCHGTLGELIALSLAVCSCKSLLYL